MKKTLITESGIVDATLSILERVFDVFYDEFSEIGNQDIIIRLRNHFMPGKMLRTRLAMALLENHDIIPDDVVNACAATELIHAATLFHDDVIDNADLRRGHPSLWCDIGPSAAILAGDLFFSNAVQLVVKSGNIDAVTSFVNKVREVCSTELVHELVFRNTELDVQKCLRVARGKTGPLFAFVAESCGGTDDAKSAALCEAGYCLGTAYQLADDLLDVIGDEQRTGKTLGTDGIRKKITLAQNKGVSEEFIREQIGDLCSEATKLLWSWPRSRDGLENFIDSDLLPFFTVSLKSNMEAVAYEIG